jgi:hypothetical protein
MKDKDNFTSFRELNIGELEAALMVEKSTIEDYKGNLSKSAEFWKAVENKLKLERTLKEINSAK